MREDRNVLDLMTARLHVRQRAARAALRHPRRLRQPVPPRHADRRRAARPARQGRDPRGHVARRRARRRCCAANGCSRTSSARRPPPPPLPGAGVFAEPAPGEAPRTMREQMEQHRANPVCASCHKLMDPIGFALENFDAVGAWRTREPSGADRRVGPAGRRHARSTASRRCARR